jgi:hypothetical protein
MNMFDELCRVCNVACESETELRLHFDSATHADSMDLVVKTGEFNHTTYLFCRLAKYHNSSIELK